MCLALVYVHFIAGQAGGDGWAGNKGHFTPRTVPAAAPSAIPAKKGHSRCCKPQTAETFFSKKLLQPAQSSLVLPCNWQVFN